MSTEQLLLRACRPALLVVASVFSAVACRTPPVSTRLAAAEAGHGRPGTVPDARAVPDVSRGDSAAGSSARASPWANPFGVFYAGHHGAVIAELGAADRVYGRQFEWEAPNGPRSADEMLRNGRGTEGLIVTLQFQTADRLRPGVESVSYHKYCLPEGAALERSVRFARQAVERYDGDADFGCMPGAGPDCYSVGDGLYPRDPAALRARPIHLWQVENEFFFQLLDCSVDPRGAPVPAEKAARYFRTMAAVIREADPQATVILWGVTGFDTILFERGLVDAVDRGDSDCNYEHITRAEVLANPARYAERRRNLALWRQRVETVLRGAAGAYDAIDFHSYSNNYRWSSAVVRWLAALGLGDLAVISTEMSGPYFMFAALGAPRPTECAEGGRDDRGPARHSERVLAEYVVKLFVVGLANGVRRMHWATGEELFDPYIDNYQRVGLVERNGRRKPAFYTYRLMIQKLRGYVGVESLGGDAYAFRFENRGPVVVAWSEGGPRTIDLSSQLPTGRVAVTRLVTETDATGNAVLPPVETLTRATVTVDEAPVFIEALADDPSTSPR